MKQCSKCGEIKPIEAFVKSTQHKSGYHTYCKSCENARTAAYRAKMKAEDPDGFAQRSRASVKKHRDNHPRGNEYERKKMLKYRFGITLEQYEAMLLEQGGGCAGCKSEPKNKSLAVDHDRVCCPGNKSCGDCVRGLLCSNCNTALGLLRDSEEVMTRLINYLKEKK